MSVCGGGRRLEGNTAERGVGGREAGGVAGNDEASGEGHCEGGEDGGSGRLLCEKTRWMSSKASAMTSWRALRVAKVDVGEAMDGRRSRWGAAFKARSK